jgi:hypothetical protein
MRTIWRRRCRGYSATRRSVSAWEAIGRQIVESNRGSVARLLELIEMLLWEPSRRDPSLSASSMLGSSMPGSEKLSSGKPDPVRSN